MEFTFAISEQACALHLYTCAVCDWVSVRSGTTSWSCRGLLLIICNTVARESAVINENLIMLGTIYSKVDLYPRETVKKEKGKFGKRLRTTVFQRKCEN